MFKKKALLAFRFSPLAFGQKPKARCQKPTAKSIQLFVIVHQCYKLKLFMKLNIFETLFLSF